MSEWNINLMRLAQDLKELRQALDGEEIESEDEEFYLMGAMDVYEHIDHMKESLSRLQSEIIHNHVERLTLKIKD